MGVAIVVMSCKDSAREEGAARQALNPSPVISDFAVYASDGVKLEGGLRAQGTFVFASDDHAQTAIEPFAGYSTPEHVGLYARYAGGDVDQRGRFA